VSRRLLLVAAGTVALVAAGSAGAASYGPACVTHLAAAASGDQRSCYTDSTPFAESTRILDVEVHEGTVQATLTCSSPWDTGTATETFAKGEKGSLSLGERYGDRCTATLRALADLTVATGVSHLRPRIHTEVSS
jgi:hypothetical protein